MSIVNEEWRDVSGFEGYYQASSLGRVRSVDRRVPDRNRFVVGRVLKTWVANNYLNLGLNLNGIRKTQRVHVLVARTFLGDRPTGFDINHIDGNKLNNRADNLEYCSHSDNINHAVRIGLCDSWLGEKHPCAKLKNSDIPLIRERRDTCAAIAKDYGVSPQLIQDVRSRKLWTHIQ